MSAPNQTELQPDSGHDSGSPQAPSPSPSPDSGGAIGNPAQLVAVREARGWSVSDLASKLGMSARQIEALERGDWNALPGRAFVRGAIRAYGKALQADVEPLLASVGGAVPATELRPSASLEAPLPKHGALGFDNGGSGSRLTWILLALLGVIAIAMYFGRGAEWSRMLQDRAGAPAGRSIESVPLQPPASAPAQSSPAPAQSSPAPATAPSVAPQSSPAAPTTQAATAGATAAVGAAGAAASTDDGRQPSRPAPAEAAPAVPPAAEGGAAASAAADTTPSARAAAARTLRFRFERESWVEVRDGAGKLILYGLQPAESAREVEGRRPYSLVVGNAEHVRLEDDGRQIDLGAIARKGVARLKID